MSRFLKDFASFILMAGLLLSGCAVNQTETATGAPLARQITQSAHCGLAALGHVLLETRSQVDRLEKLPGRRLPLGPLKSIDFSQEQVVLVALGQKPTGGFSIILDGSEIIDGQLELTVRSRGPEPGTMVTQALTTPCAVIAVAATGWKTIRITPAERNR